MRPRQEAKESSPKSRSCSIDTVFASFQGLSLGFSGGAWGQAVSCELGPGPVHAAGRPPFRTIPWWT